MTKPTTTWHPDAASGEVSNGNEDDFLLLETGDNILLETGDDILLEDTTWQPKATSTWSESDS